MSTRGSLCGLVFSLLLAAFASGQQGSEPAYSPSASDTAVPSLAAGPFGPGLAADDPASDGAVAAALSSACCDPGFTYAMAEALYYGRDNASIRQPVVIDLDRPADDNALLTTRSLLFPFEPGFRARLGYQMRNCKVIEAEYMGLFGRRVGRSVTGEGNLAIPGDLGRASNDFFDADDMNLSYRWALHSGEVNWVHPCECCCADCCGGIRRHWRQWFVGFRYLSLDEEFNIQSTDVEEGTSNYNIRTHNDLFGAQIGGRWGASRGRLGLELTGKAGLFGNASGQTQFVTDFPPPFLLRPTTGSDDGQLAFVGELGCTLLYQLTNVWAVRGGYNLMWIEGVALAPDQLDFTNTAVSGSGLAAGGGIFLHGVNMGLEARW